MKNNDNEVQEWLEKCPFDITYSKNILTKESIRYTIIFDIPNSEDDWEEAYEDEQPSDV